MELPGHEQPIVTRTLATAQTMLGRRLDVPFDLQVSLGGLEDLCADVVELGEQSDALTVGAIEHGAGPHLRSPMLGSATPTSPT